MGAFGKERFEFYQNQKILEQRIRDSAREALSRMLEIERCDPESKASGGSSLNSIWEDDGDLWSRHVQR